MYLLLNGHREFFPVYGQALCPGGLIAATRRLPLADIPLRDVREITGALCPEDNPARITTLLWFLFLTAREYPHLFIRVDDVRADKHLQSLLTALDIIPSGVRDVRGSPRLTGSEARVLLMLLSGLTVKQVSELLRRDTRTISTHKLCAMRKVGLRHNGELFRLGARLLGHQTVRNPSLTEEDARMMCALVRVGHVSRAAALLGVHIRTVSYRRRVIMKKIGVTNDVALYAALGLQDGRVSGADNMPWPPAVTTP